MQNYSYNDLMKKLNGFNNYKEYLPIRLYERKIKMSETSK